MKNSMKNSIAKDGRKSKGKFGGFRTCPKILDKYF